MKIIVTIKQIADALGLSSTWICRKAKEQNWLATGIRVQGGGDSYYLDKIPLKAKDKHKIRSKVVVILQKNKPLLERIDALEEQKQALIDVHQASLKEINKKISRIKKRLNKTATTTIEELFT